MNTTLETKRLLLRPLKQSDAIDIFENWASDEDFPKYMTWSAHKNIEKPTLEQILETEAATYDRIRSRR